MIKKIKVSKFFLAILLGGLILRLILINLGFHVDLLSIGSWSEWIYKNGPKGFYEETHWIYSWPTQLPITNLFYVFSYNLYEQMNWLFVQTSSFIAFNRLAPTLFLWWFDFVKWFGGDLFLDSSLRSGLILTIKFLAIVADLAIASILFFLTYKENLKKALLLAGLFLFLPFSWYLSAIWGQYDQIGFLFLLLSFIFLAKRNLYLAPLFLFASLNLKPTGVIFILLFVWLYFLNKPKLSEILVGIVIILGTFLYTTSLYTNSNLFNFIQHDLTRIVFHKPEFRVTTHAFNFWHILVGNKAVNQNEIFFIFPYKAYGLIIFGLLNILAFRVSKNLSLKNVFSAMFIVGMGGWLFYMNMLERYAFAGVTASFLLSIFYPGILKYAIVLSLIYWLNLYESFWFPEFLNPLRLILIWNEGFITRILSLINVLIFLRILQIVFHKLPLFTIPQFLSKIRS